MIRYSQRAEAQLLDLLLHYERLNRTEAAANLLAAMEAAEARIQRDPEAGLPTPRPYPRLARPGHAWVKSGRYWVAYTRTDPPVIVAVFHEAADIPNRV